MNDEFYIIHHLKFIIYNFMQRTQFTKLTLIPLQNFLKFTFIRFICLNFIFCL